MDVDVLLGILHGQASNRLAMAAAICCVPASGVHATRSEAAPGWINTFVDVTTNTETGVAVGAGTCTETVPSIGPAGAAATSARIAASASISIGAAAAAGAIDLDSLVTHRVPLAKAMDALCMMRDQSEFFAKVLIQP